MERKLLRVYYSPKGFWKGLPAVRSWLKKPECLRRLQSFGWWSKPSGRFICLPWSISWDKLLMSNLQMQLVKLIFFSSLMTKWLQGCGNSTGMHWLLLMLQADSRLRNLSPQKNFLRSQRLFRQSVSMDHWDGPKFFRLILGMNSWVMSRELTKHDVKIRRGNMTFHRDQGIVGQFNWTLGECLFTFQYSEVE